MTDFRQLSKGELIKSAYEMTGGNIKDLSLEQIVHLITVTQFVTNLCINEIERRGELTYAPYCDEGRGGLVPIVPYYADYDVETVLTRRN